MAGVGHDPMRIGILGPGALGGFVGGALARAGHEVAFVAGPSVSVTPTDIAVSSLRLGDFRASVSVTESLTAALDVLFITVKAPSLVEALREIDPAMIAEGQVVPLMNGIDHVASIRERVSKHVVAGTIRVEADRPARGVYRQLSPFADVRLGPAPSAPDRRESLQAALVAAGLTCETSEDELTLMWSKLTFLAPLALATAATGWPIGGVLEHPEWRARLLAACSESCAVATAEGASVDPDAVQRALVTLPPAMRSSMQRDIEAGRPNELDAIGGAVVRHGRSADVPTPVVEGLIEAVGRRRVLASARTTRLERAREVSH